MFTTSLRFGAAALLMILASAPLDAAQPRRARIEGPVRAELVRVVDGDTVLVAAEPWPQQQVMTYVRLRGIDAPEIHSRCPEIRQAAQRAAERLESMLSANEPVYLMDISGDKYFGRVVADLRLENGRSAATALLEAGLVRPYEGGRKPATACAD